MKLRPLTLAFFLVLPVSMAAAQPFGWEQRRVQRYQEDPYAYSYAARGPYGEVCQRWCPHDAVPSDPPHFKIADGRCQEKRGNR